MAFRIDDDENRIQDLKDQIDQLEIQTFSPEVVARNESTRNTGIQTGDSAATNAYPQWMPIRDFGSVGSLTLDVILNRTNSHVAKLTAIGDIDFAFSLPPGTNKMMQFILDVTVDGIGGYTFNLLNNILPSGISINNSANARTVIRFTTTDAGVTYYAEDISISAGGGGGNVPDGTIAFQHLEWDGAAWIAQQALAFGGSSADAGEIRFPNDTIGLAWRNISNDGNIEIKVNASDFVDITNSANDTVGLFLRAQDATESDISSSWTQESNVGGLGGTTKFAYPTELEFLHGATTIALFDSTDEINFFRDVDHNNKDVFNINRIHLSGGDSSPLGVDEVSWYLSGTGDLINNIGAGDEWGWSSDNIIKMILTDSTLEKRNVTAPNFQLYNTRIAQVGTAGTIAILANSVNIPTGATMGFIIADTEVETGDGTGSMKLGVNLNGIVTSFIEINDSNDGNIKLKADVDADNNDFIKIDRIQMSGGTVSATSVNDVVWYLSSNGDLVSNINATDGWIWTSGNITKMVLTDSTLEKRNVTAPTFQLYNTRLAQVGTAGTIAILANSVNIPTGATMGFIIADTEVETGDGTGSMKLGVNVNGFLTSFIEINDSNDGNIKFKTNLDLGNNFIQLDEITLPSNPPANTGLIYLRDVVGITTPFFLDSAGTETSLLGGGSSPLTTKGDLYGFSTVDERISVGTDGQVLTANSAVSLGVEWQDPSSFDATGLQDFKLSLDHETPEYDFEIWLSNAKQGGTDFDSTSPVYNPILVSTQYYLPIYIGQRAQVIRVGVDVGVVDFDDMAMAIYDSQPLQNYPNQRVSNVVTGFISSTGILDLFFAQNLEAGLYFFSIWIDGNAESATFLYHPASSANCIGWRPENGDSGPMLPINGFIEVGVSQSLPSSAPDDMVALPQEVPAIFAKLGPNTS